MDDFQDQEDDCFNLDGKFLSLVQPFNGKPKHFIKSPSAVTFVPQFGVYFVTDSTSNKIGVYEENFQFRSWLQAGNTINQLENPSSIICLKNGHVAILDQTHLHIFDSTLTSCQSIPGSYRCLAEGSELTLFTILQNSSQAFLKVLKMHELNLYKWTHSTELLVAQDNLDWASSSSCRNILVHKNMVYISDTGLKKVYMVDLSTQRQTASHLQLHQPSGLSADDKDNILISDCCKIIICDSKLQTSRVLIEGLLFVTDLFRHGNFFLAIKSRRGTEASVIKLKITDKSSDFIKSWFEKGLSRNSEKTRSKNANKTIASITRNLAIINYHNIFKFLLLSSLVKYDVHPI